MDTRSATARTSYLLTGALALGLLSACDGVAAEGRVAAPLTAACLTPESPVEPGSWVCGAPRVHECDAALGSHPGVIHVLPAVPPGSSEPVACSEANVELSAAGPFQPGAHDVTVRSTDAGGFEWCTSRLTVQDTLAPAVVARRLEMWPPNHKMQAFSPYDCLDIVDACDPNTVAAFTWATSDEPDDGQGDGHTSADIALSAARVELRAERSGGGDGRVYTMGWVVADASGNHAEGTCEIVVPHDQGKGQAVFSGAAVTEVVAEAFVVGGAEVSVGLDGGLPVVSVEAYKP